MNPILQLNPSHAARETEILFEVSKRRAGEIANIIRVLGNSPAALKGFLRLSEALSGGALTAKLREQVALAVSEINGCAYCLSAHSIAGEIAGLSQAEISAARFATGTDTKSEAVLDLVWAIMVEKGKTDDFDVQAARSAGLSDEEVVEVVANIALTTLTNYLNQVAKTVIDYPEVSPGVISNEALASILFADTRQKPEHGHV